ncbi:MAG TPA: hypothetical protein VJI52_04070 [Candidatus Nanoarchaeia archaeon]|nr:hypothetical protein [Candidatus Nanoarchaeia archaeon]
MEDKEIRKQLLSIFGPQLKFNKEFDKCAEQLKEGMLQDLLTWCDNCKNDLADMSKTLSTIVSSVFLSMLGNRNN